MLINALVNGVETRKFFGLRVDEGEDGTGVKRPVAAPKTEMIDVPGMSGNLDVSEAFTGYPVYETITVEVPLVVADVDLWDRMKLSFLREVSGQQIRLSFSDDPDRYFYGRATIADYTDRSITKGFLLSVSADPFRYTDETMNVPLRTTVTEAVYPGAWTVVSDAGAVYAPYLGGIQVTSGTVTLQYTLDTGSYAIYYKHNGAGAASLWLPSTTTPVVTTRVPGCVFWSAGTVQLTLTAPAQGTSAVPLRITDIVFGKLGGGLELTPGQAAVTPTLEITGNPIIVWGNDESTFKASGTAVMYGKTATPTGDNKIWALKMTDDDAVTVKYRRGDVI